MLEKCKRVRDNIKKIPDRRILNSIIDESTLSLAEKKLLKMKYAEHKSSKECATILKYSPNYISKVHIKALLKLEVPLKRAIKDLNLE